MKKLLLALATVSLVVFFTQAANASCFIHMYPKSMAGEDVDKIYLNADKIIKLETVWFSDVEEWGAEVSYQWDSGSTPKVVNVFDSPLTLIGRIDGC